MRRLARVVLAVCSLIGGGSELASAAGIVGTEVGIMIPTDHLRHHVDEGGTLGPYVGYMWNGNFGFLCSLQSWAAESDGKKEVGAVLGAMMGPRLALPLGRVELWGTFEGGLFTALTDEALTDTSWAMSPGGGVNYFINHNV